MGSSGLFRVDNLIVSAACESGLVSLPSLGQLADYLEESGRSLLVGFVGEHFVFVRKRFGKEACG